MLSGHLGRGSPSISEIRFSRAHLWQQQSSPEKRAGTPGRGILQTLNTQPVLIARSGRRLRHLAAGGPASPAVGIAVFSGARPASFPAQDKLVNDTPDGPRRSLDGVKVEMRAGPPTTKGFIGTG